MKTEIKICGLSSKEAISASLSAGADLLGFIFFEKSPRHLTLQNAALLSSIDGVAGKKVAVSVNAEPDYLDRIVEALKPDFLQLHGSESPQRVREVKQRYGLGVIKAFAILTSADFDNLKPYEGIVDRFLLDAKAPKGSQLPGGNGVSFDWNLIAEMKSQTPYMLSGGLDISSIASALKISGANSIDISSGVESRPGVKDIAKIEAFIKTVREYDARMTGNNASAQKSAHIGMKT